MKQPAIYMMANKIDGTIYTGMTTDLIRRVWEHKEKLVDGFTKKYDCTKLVYYELSDTIEGAATREKQLKGGSRKQKTDLINNFNPEWRDLYDEICV